MADATLCEACKDLLGGSRRRCEGDRSYYIQHGTADSFRLATEMGCEICIRLRLGFVQDYSHEKKTGLVEAYETSTTITVEDTTLGWGPTKFAGVWTNSHRPWLTFMFVNELDDHTLLVILLFGVAGTVQLPDNLGCINTGDHQAIAFAQAQYMNCLREHEKCRSSLESPGFLPTRLLQIHSAETSSVRLCESARIPSGAQYATLSHCWGQAQPTVLTKSTEQGLRHGVLKDTLPLTFQQAIEVATAFGISYLWIDSICIFQDDLRDWESEANLMRDVYRNAAFGIAATAAKDGTHGLFRDRDCRSFDPVQVMATWQFTSQEGEVVVPGMYWCMAHPLPPALAIDIAPLNQRAWVAQERYLSRRMIHFTQNLLFWECCENFTSETHPVECFSCSCGGGYSNPRLLKRLVNSTKLYQRVQAGHSFHSRTSGSPDIPSIHKIYDAWLVYRDFYTQCQLTNESDILIALRGITSEVGKLLNDRVVFGLWIERLVSDLAWAYPSPEPGVKYNSSPWRAPSWSWAKSMRPSQRTNMEIEPDDVAHDMVHIIKAPIETTSPANVHLCSIVMRCRLITSSVTHSISMDPFTPDLDELYTVGTMDPRGLYDTILYLDDIPERDIMHFNMGECILECELLILRRCRRSSGKEVLDCLLVVLRDELTKTYERIGYCRLDYDFIRPGMKASEILDLHNALEDQEITLI